MAYKTTKNLVMENARLIFRNFSGNETRFNRNGNRNFCVIIDNPEQAEELRKHNFYGSRCKFTVNLNAKVRKNPNL